MPGRFLFITWAGGGNVHPLVALGKRLLAAGHEVRVIGPSKLAGRFEPQGMSFRPHRTAAEWTGSAEPAAWPRSEEERTASLRGMAADVADELAREPTDVVVVDFMQPDAWSAAEASGLPVVGFVHTLFSRMPRDDPFSPMSIFTDVAGLNALRAELGLEPLGRNADLLDRATRVIVATVPELDRPDVVPQNVRYVGPILEEVDRSDGPPDPRSSDAPLIVVSLGTTPMDEAPVIRSVIDALAGLPARGLVTVGAHLQPEDFPSASNVEVSGFVPHAAVLPSASVFVGHAGLGGISVALACGVPMVLAPFGRDQPANAAHVEAIGAGVTVSKDASTDELRSAITTVLTDDAYRDAARVIAATIEPYGNGRVAVRVLEELLP
jgi:MGT family glycosyltransferase